MEMSSEERRGGEMEMSSEDGVAERDMTGRGDGSDREGWIDVFLSDFP